MSTDLVSDFEQRGLLHQLSSPRLRDALGAGIVTGYVGFDPTAASLHVGSLLPVLALVRLQRAGHRPIALVGGGTGMIGDPSGKAAERTLLTRDVLAHNVAGLRAQLGRFLDFGAGGAQLLDNHEWLAQLSLLEFLRDIGKHFSVNEMTNRDSVRNRLEREQGLSFTEFSYMLLQAYDFVALHDRTGCTLQMGGSDQWGNIVSGVDLIRRLRGKESFGLTWPLMTRADGQKFGKSEKGNVWLDPGLTSPYEFFQFWLNVDDADVGRYLRSFTFLPMEEVSAIEARGASEPGARHAQRSLAREVTRIVHGDDALARAERLTELLFRGAPLGELTEADLRDAFANAPSTSLGREALGTAAASLVALLGDEGQTGLYPSRGRARKDVESGAVSVNNVVVRDPARVITADDLLPGGFVALRKGKKTYHVLRVS